MKNTLSALKWLAEKRARLAHDVAQTERIAAEVTRRLENLRLDLAGVDRSIQVYDPAINPESIAPIQAHVRHGKRGSLRQTMIEALQTNSPAWSSTDTIELLVATALGLTFELAAERKRWYDNVFRKQLKRLVTEGLVERLQDPLEPTTEIGRWRWKQTVSATLQELKEGASGAAA